MTEQTNSSKKHFRIRVENRNQEYFCEAGKNLLTGMESDNQNCINVGCRGGGCGVCKIRILEGDYNQKRMSKAHINEQDKLNGFALACRIFPIGDMTIESDHHHVPVKKAPVNEIATDRDIISKPISETPSPAALDESLV